MNLNQIYIDRANELASEFENFEIYRKELYEDVISPLFHLHGTLDIWEWVKTLIEVSIVGQTNGIVTILNPRLQEVVDKTSFMRSPIFNYPTWHRYSQDVNWETFIISEYDNLNFFLIHNKDRDIQLDYPDFSVLKQDIINSFHADEEKPCLSKILSIFTIMLNGRHVSRKQFHEIVSAVNDKWEHTHQTRWLEMREWGAARFTGNEVLTIMMNYRIFPTATDFYYHLQDMQIRYSSSLVMSRLISAVMSFIKEDPIRRGEYVIHKAWKKSFRYLSEEKIDMAEKFFGFRYSKMNVEANAIMFAENSRYVEPAITDDFGRQISPKDAIEIEFLKIHKMTGHLNEDDFNSQVKEILDRSKEEDVD